MPAASHPGSYRGPVYCGFLRRFKFDARPVDLRILACARFLDLEADPERETGCTITGGTPELERVVFGAAAPAPVPGFGAVF